MSYMSLLIMYWFTLTTELCGKDTPCGHRTSDRDMRQDCTNKEETPYEEKEKDIRGEKTGERDKKRSEMRQGEKRQ